MTYDVVGVGTSPLVLMRAIAHARQGRRVLLCDRQEVVGGAWAVANVLGFENVETGVHLFENRPAMRRTLGQLLGDDLQRDRCATLVSGAMLPMSIARGAFHAAVGVNAFRRGLSDRGRRALGSAWRATRHLAEDFYYPSGGAAQITTALAAQFRGLGGEIRLGLELLEAELAAGGVVCRTRHDKFAAKRLLVSSRACPDLRLSGTLMRPETECSQVHNAVLHLRASSGLSRAYVEILGDKDLKRVRDVGRLAQPRTGHGEILMCVQYRDPGRAEGASIGAYLAEQLARLKLIGGGVSVVGAVAKSTDIVTVTDRGLLCAAQAAGPALEVLRTTDFAEGLVTAQREQACH